MTSTTPYAQPLSLSSAKAVQDQRSRIQFASLEYLRVIASFMIILFHAHSISLRHADQQGLSYFSVPIFWYGCIDLFFVMSGFLMIHMSRNLYGRSGGLRNFLLRRITRTPPLYWVYTIGIAAIFTITPTLSSQGTVGWKWLVGSMLFYPMARDPIIAIGWTLEYEVFFYIVIGLSILLPYRWGWKFALSALIGAVSLGIALGVKANPWGTWTNPLLLDFAIGICVAVTYYSGVSLSRIGTWIAVILGLVLICVLHRLTPRDLLRPATAGAGVGLIVAAATMTETPWRLGRFHRFAHELSNQTYTMYLCHILVLKLFESLYFRFFTGFGADITFILVGFIVVVIVSRGLYVIGERPITEYLRQLLKKLHAPRP
jgi:exopolysaccharide production protein ExoZ